MENKIIKGYKISGNRVAHMKLTSISLPKNETLSMFERYRFDAESTKKMLDDSRRISEEYNIKKKQKEYEEMNIDAIYSRMLRLSTLKLLKELLKMF